jgi:SAM-dependent methyltransferase
VNVSYSDLVTEMYEISQPIGRSVGDVEYYSAQLADVDGPVLEAACGTGRILIPLAAAGHTMAGVDDSAAMIAACARNCREHGVSAELFTASMTEFVRKAVYAAVIVPRGSIRAIKGREATLDALRCFHRSLAPQGTLKLDLSPPKVATELGPMEYWEAGSTMWTRHDVRIDYDPVSNFSTKLTRYEKWHDGVLIATELRRFFLQHWNVHEFTDVLREAGFGDIEVTADYRADPPRPDSRRWVYRAIRA